ncbi:hypothetical protein [Bacteroides muris (ex Fokt et al. 2023)]|jgi:hypothetical protein|uniref:DUF4382 domain-containing protein n=1 Tax=Bacteroides muris (ex Fokt et al. 2023) TaxID=2937417 RepID=A0A9X2SSX2_9BACE|nr:hypothetical protein [Bacteroides muris (ex Fokt et al. 2023)]MCR6504077.1 hypothetical protein [Bacteroides muris (ex Fokt et al. 2023)]MCR6507694.1 hypothetical protein [Bacteroides muris (ex Fokt et al. 2023)]
MHQNFILTSAKKAFRVIGLLFITLIFASSCSEDDTTYTGILNIEITNWQPEWISHLFVIISPLEQQDEIIKIVKLTSDAPNHVELNPGNYKILIRADNNDYTPYITESVQIQIGKTETVVI